ncbi:MAG: hypothetical protein ABH952_08515 [Candidatus Omnitrophota bacterium]
MDKEKEELKGLLLQCYSEMQRSNKIIGYEISQEFLDKLKNFIELIFDLSSEQSE